MVKKNIEFIPDFRLSKLKKYKNNPKVNDKTIEALSKSLNRFGAIAPIIVNEEFIICDGHARYDAAIERGDKTFPVLIAPQLIGDNFKAYNIAATQTARLAEWDEPILAEIIKSLADSGYEIDSLGFDGNELEDIMNSLDDGAGGTTGLTDPDEVPEPPKKPITKPGDLWQLGRHRLLCGDVMKKDNVQYLLKNIDVYNMITDPPYNINFRYNKINDKKSDREYSVFCKTWFETFNPKSLIFSPGPRNIKNYPNPKDIGIWIKRNATAGASVFHYRTAEPLLFYGEFKVKRNTDIFDFSSGFSNELKEAEKKSGVSECHAPSKPINLWTELINMFDKNPVVDCFIGSGTTIISCENTNRYCYAMDIDPQYCDVSIMRWENFTGQKAKRI